MKGGDIMGLFSKIFGNDFEAKVVKGALNDIMGAAKNNSDVNNREPDEEKTPAASASIYDQIPAEENQYNFNGSYTDYFDKVFREEFPEYEITHKKADYSRTTATVFTFRFGGNVVLIVELMSESSSINKLRTQCKNNGTPYLRFYYNHRGWWNTRAYVTERTGKALGR